MKKLVSALFIGAMLFQVHPASASSSVIIERQHDGYGNGNDGDCQSGGCENDQKRCQGNNCRGSFSPGPFDRSPVDISHNQVCISPDCSSHQNDDKKDGK